MATEKSTATPASESVSVAEDTLKESVANTVEESAPTEASFLSDTSAPEVDTQSDACEDGETCDDTVEINAYLTDLAGKSKSELLDMLARIISEHSVQDIRRKVDAIKVAFYKRHRAEVDDLRKSFVAEHGDDAEFVAEPDAEESRLKDLLKVYRSKRDEESAATEKAKEENYKIKLEIIEGIKNLVKNEETLNNTFTKFRELQTKWKETGPVPQQYTKDIGETYNLHVENFYDFVKINKELRDLDWKKNLESKTALCEQAERLAEDPSVVEAFRKLQKLHDDWREIGPVASEYKEALWERFKEASSKINRRHQDFFERLKSDQLNNLARKTALCEAAESLIVESISSHKAWNKANEKLLEIQSEWKKIGFAPKKDNTKIYDRFRAACDTFFSRKREFYTEVKNDMENNLHLKEALCEAAEKLQDSEDWKSATDELLALQAKWKEVGVVSRRHSDAIWKRFRTACDKFFERKSAHFASIENEYDENLRKKRELIEQMSVADIKDGGYELIQNFQRRWGEIGYVPIKHKDALQKQYKEAIDRLFNALRGSSREQSMSRFKDKVSSLRSSGDKRLRTERDKLYNRVRQLEQEIALLENNIGFFGKSKGAEAMIAEVRDKISRAKQEMSDAIEKVKLIDGEQ